MKGRPRISIDGRETPSTTLSAFGSCRLLSSKIVHTHSFVRIAKKFATTFLVFDLSTHILAKRIIPGSQLLPWTLKTTAIGSGET